MKTKLNVRYSLTWCNFEDLDRSEKEEYDQQRSGFPIDWNATVYGDNKLQFQFMYQSIGFAIPNTVDAEGIGQDWLVTLNDDDDLDDAYEFIAEYDQIPEIVCAWLAGRKLAEDLLPNRRKKELGLA